MKSIPKFIKISDFQADLKIVTKILMDIGYGNNLVVNKKVAKQN